MGASTLATPACRPRTKPRTTEWFRWWKRCWRCTNSWPPRTPQERTALERQIAATDTQIDRLVARLYGLTGDEIKIVEGQTK